MSAFGDLMKRLRKERFLTLEVVAKKIGSHKGYVSGIENGKVNPPSVKITRKFAKLFGQDERLLVLMAWADKAPSIVREEFKEFVLALSSKPAREAFLWKYFGVTKREAGQGKKEATA